MDQYEILSYIAVLQLQLLFHARVVCLSNYESLIEATENMESLVNQVPYSMPIHRAKKTIATKDGLCYGDSFEQIRMWWMCKRSISRWVRCLLPSSLVRSRVAMTYEGWCFRWQEQQDHIEKSTDKMSSSISCCC